MAGVGLNTTITNLERWSAPKEVQASGFGKLKVEGQDVTVCAKAVNDVNKIGEHLHRLSDMNPSKSKQNDWENNKIPVRELQSQIHKLGATIDGMKASSANLKSRDDIKAAIKFTKQLDTKAAQMRDAIDGMMGKVDDKTKNELVRVRQELMTVGSKNASARADLKEMKVTKHAKPEKIESDFFLKTYKSLRTTFGLGTALKTVAGVLSKIGLIENLDAKVEKRLVAQRDAIIKKMEQLGEVSFNTTMPEEVAELRFRARDTAGDLAALRGTVLALASKEPPGETKTTLTKLYMELGGEETKVNNFGNALEQKQDLLEIRDKIQAFTEKMNKTNRMDVRGVDSLAAELADIKVGFGSSTRGAYAKGNRELFDQLAGQIEQQEAAINEWRSDLLEGQATFVVESYAKQAEKIAERTDNALRTYKQEKEIQGRIEKPELLQKELAGIAKDIEVLRQNSKKDDGSQEYMSWQGTNIALGQLSDRVKKAQTELARDLEAERVDIRLSARSLTNTFQQLNQLAAAPKTDERLNALYQARGFAVADSLS